ncbi:MAG: class I SAM-dependent methyltransferase [Myxococcales bacterium]|nr:class I SAM-dependent methyltransferase [Myxococcales bacterium]
MGSTFDAEYYRRYYDSAATRVHQASEIAHLCAAVTAFAAWWKIPITSVLDVGAGVGLWRDWFAKHRPRVAYRSTEISKHACEAYGHERRDISKWRAKEQFDLVVCQGVLPYLDDDACARALENIAAMSAGLLYLEAITKRDMRDVIDNDRTDVRVYPRTGTFYKSCLKPHFVQVGAGLWCRRDGPALFYELESAGR